MLDLTIRPVPGTLQNAVADYMPDEPRYMRRCQVMATLDYAALAA